jgi:hypothetical protein
MKNLLDHPKAIRDAVFLQATALSHAIEYSNMLEAGLKCITRKTLYGHMPSQENNLLFACAHAHDWVQAIMMDEDKICIPSSTIQLDRVNTCNSRRK